MGLFSGFDFGDVDNGSSSGELQGSTSEVQIVAGQLLAAAMKKRAYAHPTSPACTVMFQSAFIFQACVESGRPKHEGLARGLFTPETTADPNMFCRWRC